MTDPKALHMSARREVSDQSVWNHLSEAWASLRDGASPVRKARVAGAVEMAFAVGALDVNDRELWIRRIDTYPGHDDEGGRTWCAFCGNLPTEAKT